MEIPAEYRHLICEEDLPEWVIRHETQAPSVSDRGGLVCPALLRDVQHHLELNTIFRRIVIHLPNISSVQYGSRLEIEFSPEVERLIIHTIHVQRGGETIDLRPRQSLRVLNREAEMERFAFNGRLLAVLLLQDIRAGDTVDYSYSLQAIKEPLFGRISGRFLLQSTVAANAVRCRLLYHAQRVVYAQPRNCDLQPQATSTESGLTDCRWEIDNVTTMELEADMPPWAVPFRWIDYGEFSTWDEVAVAASRLFEMPETPLYPELANWLEAVRASAPTPEEFIVQIVRYVQDHIRYVSISIDEHTSKPYDIPIILERHYGDCKDKAILLCRLLREVGYDAVPALVHSQMREHATQGLPRPGAFNHAIVRLRHDGCTHWIDATLNNQGGRLADISCPPYGVALILCSPGESVENIPLSHFTNSVSYDEFVKVHQTGGMAELSVTRTFIGAAADGMRHQLSTFGLTELDNRFLADYQRAYRNVTFQSLTQCEDNRDENRIKLVHNLSLAEIWVPVAQRNDVNQAAFPIFGIRSILYLPEIKNRKFPCTFQHPIKVSANLEIRLPSGFKPSRSQVVIKSSAFLCKYSQETSSNSARIHFDYSSTMDYVLIKDLAQHATAINQVARLGTFGVNTLDRVISRGNGRPLRR